MTESPYLPPIPPTHEQLPPAAGGQITEEYGSGEYGAGQYDDVDVPRPATVGYYNVYCVIMALVYLACLAFGIFLFGYANELADADDLVAIQIQGGVLAVMGSGLFLVFAIAPFLPRRKWVWIYGFFPIAIGMTSACCMPVTIPLLIFWIREDVKCYFRIKSPIVYDPYLGTQDV